MNLLVFENNKPFVMDEFREGRFDYVELASDVAETKFFEYLFGQQIVDRLAEHYPSWWDCPAPLTGVSSRDLYADGHEESWLLVTTNEDWSARRVRDLYALRTDIEERHRQVKCFWDLTRFHSTAWSLVVSQTVFVCLTYSLLQIHLLQQGHQELNRRTWPTSRRLLPDGDRVIIYRQQSFAFFTLLEHMDMTLNLEGKARRRAQAKTRRLLQDAAAAGATARRGRFRLSFIMRQVRRSGQGNGDITSQTGFFLLLVVAGSPAPGLLD